MLSDIALPASAAAEKPSFPKKMQMGQLLYFNGNVDRAIKCFKDAAKLKPDAFEPHLNLVNIYVQKQEFAEAVEEAREGLKIKPNHRDLHLILGNLLRTLAGQKDKDSEEQKKLLEEATKELGIAQEMGANKALINSTLSVIHIQQGNFDKAMEHCDAALEQKDNLPDAHLIKGVLHFKKGEKEIALKEIDLAIKQKGKNAEARNTKADILVGSGKVEEALEEYKRALKDDEKYHQSMMGIANLLIQKQKWEEALEHLQKASELKPDDANILYSIGVCLEKLGKVDLAIPKFNDGVLVDPNPTTRAQITMHIRDLQQRQLLRVPTLLSPGGAGSSLGSGAGSELNLPGSAPLFGPGSQAVPGSGLFAPGSSMFGASFKDMIKIKGPSDKETKEQEKKDQKGN